MHMLAYSRLCDETKHTVPYSALATFAHGNCRIGECTALKAGVKETVLRREL